jgi:cyclase
VSIRIIARLDIKGPNLVKGIHFEGLRVLGKPEYFARHYYESGIDELCYMDAVASLYGRNSLLETVKKTSREIFVPLTVGGGLRSIDDIRMVLRAGADKVSLNTAVIRNPNLIREASRAFGSSTIVVSIEAHTKQDGDYEAYVNYGRDQTGVDVLKWAQQAVELGAGELVVTSIDKEGTGMGYDLTLIRNIADTVSVPVIAHGGAGNPEHIQEVILEGHADAVSLASMLHYECIQSAQMHDDNFVIEGNTEYLRKRSVFSKIQPTSIGQIKSILRQHNIDCRPQEVST